MAPQTSPSPEEWLQSEDEGCRPQRAERLAWLLSVTPSAKIWTFSGGWLGLHLFEEARYSYVYGQFLATTILGFAYVERSLASLLYRDGRDDMERARSETLFREARRAGLLTEDELAALDKARRLRNALTHFRRPLDKSLPETRSYEEDREPHEVVEDDARLVLEAAFRLVEKQAVNLGSERPI